ncbi:MAG: ABC-F family ATP-binding cassette domain-containing protein, partial [Clostridia bacterium]|nr:ABC-F family ATP-binding cassette domain-containing protein [Clostridia bacterium]
MISVSCDGISLSFGPDDVLKDVSFALNEGEKLGVVGVNGAGKSTLLGIIAGTVTDHGGSVSVSKDMTVGLLSQTALPNGDRTVLEEAFSAFGELVKREKELEELKKLAERDEKAAVRFAAE